MRRALGTVRIPHFRCCHRSVKGLAARAGREHLYVAMKVRGEILDDRFTLWFDPREPEKLRAVGGYYWVSGQVKQDGVVVVRPGETSDRNLRCEGRWRKSGDGMTHIELAIPYAIFKGDRFPTSGDLGFSLCWDYRDAEKNVTHLQWSDRGHPWTPVGYGVLRLQSQADADVLPYAVWLR